MIVIQIYSCSHFFGYSNFPDLALNFLGPTTTASTTSTIRTPTVDEGRIRELEEGLSQLQMDVAELKAFQKFSLNQMLEKMEGRATFLYSYQVHT